jgi:hypothetical protein
VEEKTIINPAKQEILVPEITPEKPISNKQKWNWKDYLLGFFVVEHISILLFVCAAVFMYVNVYSFSEFATLTQTAQSFVPDSSDTVYDVLKLKLAKTLPTSIDETAGKRFQLELSEQEINSLMSSFSLSYVTSTYVMFQENNNIYISLLLDDVPQPFLIHATYVFLPDNGLDITFHNFQLGPVPLPASWLVIVENSLEQSTKNLLVAAPENNKFAIKGMENTQNGVLLDISVLLEQYTELYGYVLSETEN